MPGSDGPSAAPIARKREFIRAAAASAAPTPPPPATIATAVNCADPAYTIADITIVARGDSPAESASTPNVIDTRPPAMANGTPARTPSRKVGAASGGAPGRSVTAISRD